MKLSFSKGRKAPAPLDELGGRADGALAILLEDGERVHMSASRVTSALRYFLARVQAGTGLPRRLAITSALHGEGVTYVTRTLAAIIAYDTDSTVASIDLNWRRPREQEPDEVRPSTLVDAVERGAPIESILRETTNPRLFLVDSGEVALARRPGMARSRGLQRVINQISERVDHVLLDVPPVLASSDAILLTQLADAYAFVVRHGTTASTQVEMALEELRGMEGCGIILNRADSNVPPRLRRMLGA